MLTETDTFTDDEDDDAELLLLLADEAEDSDTQTHHDDSTDTKLKHDRQSPKRSLRSENKQTSTTLKTPSKVTSGKRTRVTDYLVGPVRKRIREGFTDRMTIGRLEHRHAAENATRAESVKKSSGFDKRVKATSKEKVPEQSLFSEENGRVDNLAGLRLKSCLHSTDFLNSRLHSLQVVSLRRLIRTYVGPADEPPSDWITIGIVAHKSEQRTASNGKPFRIFKLSDLNGANVNMFLFDKVLQMWGECDVGMVLVILNPKIMLPSEKGNAIGLNIENPHKWMNIGMSRDLTFCKFEPKVGNKCPKWLDKRKGDHCDLHAVEVYKNARLKRQEVLGGTNMFTIGDPKQSLPRARHSRSGRLLSSNAKDPTQGTYTFEDGEALSTGGLDKGVHDGKVLRPCKAGAELGVEETKALDSMMQTGTPGAKYLRAAQSMARGKKDTLPEKKGSMFSLGKTEGDSSKQLFSARAMSRMGFDPVSGIEFVPVVKKEAASKPTVEKTKLDRRVAEKKESLKKAVARANKEIRDANRKQRPRSKDTGAGEDVIELELSSSDDE
ncbi:hypothetical protein DFS34DRAFT_650709 [Phlyctochytrium arcticum]|nr:hypothetical protein DFS34DRAFT_650709 [Phlyctochytrium arcticum]